MTLPPSALPLSARSPSPPAPSESFLSDLDGTAPSLIETSPGTHDAIWAQPKDASGLNLVSWKYGVDAEAGDGVEKRGFNAISGVLAHPTKRANPLRSSRQPLPPLQPPPPLPKPPPPASYDAYLSSITPLYESFVASQAVSKAAGAGGELDARSPAPLHDLPPLDSVPDIFFDPSFSLSDPSIWSQLSASPSTSSAPDSGVQAALSSHLDTLERHLIHEITLRTPSFFSALTNLQDLHSESTSCLTHITSLQTSLKSVGSTQSSRGLQIINAQEELRGLKEVRGGVEALGEVEEMYGMADKLVEEGDWEGGLGCVEDVVRWWTRYDPLSGESLPLSTLPALASLPTTITNLITKTSHHLSSSLASYLTSLLSRPLDQPPREQELRGSLAPMLEGLLKCGKAGGVEGIWREVVTAAVREESRKWLPGSEEDGVKNPDARGASLAQSLQGLEHEQFMELCDKMYGALLARLTSVKTIGGVMEEIISSSNSITPISISSFPPDSRPLTPLTLTLSETLASSSELAHTRISKILSVRSDPHALLPLPSFLHLYTTTTSFITSTESLSGKSATPLRGVLNAQARGFVQRYHQERLTSSARAVEEEVWTQVDVARGVQRVVELIVQAGMEDPAECFIPPKTTIAAEDAEDKTTTKQLAVEDQKYCLVKATAESLLLLGDYLKIVVNLESVVTDVMSRIIEFLKSFNSRTCQVVLGAGAMRSAGLKNITAKHLALASQSLSVIVSLIPYIREFVRRHLGERQAIMLVEFDKLKRDYQEHQNEIHAKLVAIMSDRLAVHCASLREIKWESTPTKEGPNSYAEMLVKESATLHKVLSKYVSSSTVEHVMGDVIEAIARRLSEEFGKVELKSEEARKRMLHDVAIISIRLKPLSDRGQEIVQLENAVRSKTTPMKTAPVEVEKKVEEKTTEIGGSEKGSDEEKKDNGEGGAEEVVEKKEETSTALSTETPSSPSPPTPPKPNSPSPATPSKEDPPSEAPPAPPKSASPPPPSPPSRPAASLPTDDAEVTNGSAAEKSEETTVSGEAASVVLEEVKGDAGGKKEDGKEQEAEVTEKVEEEEDKTEDEKAKEE
ncbi:hypothetical protein L198_08208 [Cryptococcus wingfieldii CBS 7118]|uniref:Vacuolar protein sorting-associated protein 54 C-terminal domain-containing protein n=1 Tax=Cryptococcus wingfieldii CBS 7118 TaxID=1295528 RepID=A0A1E3HHL3_9TREE|nr:hypothetical protein L198_08208 [Cryptococcus wingfieldii CBS 7118]ODN74901.1 hypothetical protein L198_08208 [Cryptococcus wingfieldii CBS 7118]